MLTLAKLPSSDNGQQWLTAQYGEVSWTTQFPTINLSEQKSQKSPLKNFNVTSHVGNGTSINDNTTPNKSKTEALKEVSEILFSDIPQQIKVLELLLHDIQRGNHLLLVENRGLENKKIADRLLQHLKRPTEYTQLHPDTTIQSLTVQPTVKNGTVVYEDSPLVRAVKYGYVLVVDEADKAPTKVTSSLHTLMDNREMVLGDGRRIIPKEIMNSSGTKSAGLIPVHENFRVIVMARRTGFPYLKNSSVPSGHEGRNVSSASAPPPPENLSRHRRRFVSPYFRSSEIGITITAVGSSPVVTTVVMGGHGTGPHTATAIVSDSAVATATAITYGRGTSTAMANSAGSSVATVIAHSYDAGVATATLSTSGSSVGGATAHAHDAGVATTKVSTSGSAVGKATADAHNAGRAIATVTCTGSSVAGGTANSQDEGVATAMANTAGSLVVNAQAMARGNEVVTQIKP